MKKRIANLKERINTCLNSKNEWNEERANEILSYFIPRAAVWSEDTKTFYYANSGTDWDLNYCIEYLNKEDRIWWNCNSKPFGGKIKTYLVEEFELDGFTKEIVYTNDEGWVEILFKSN